MESTNASECLKAVLGEAFVKNDEATLRSYGSSITGTFIQPACVVFPSDANAVIEVVKVAAEKKLTLYPISRGKNFGYGDAQGSAASQVIVDLSAMQRITLNEKLAYVTIEPGVSQQQLFSFLQQSESKLQLDVTGAGLAASIAGNILERGFGHTDYGDRFAHLINLTAVLPNGSVIKTGFAQFENCNAQNVYRHGVGPALDGLFSQSALGIVTEMTIELLPKPEKMLMFVMSTKKEDDIGNIVEAIRLLKLNGIVNSAIHIANKSRAIGEKENRFAGAWNLSGSISGPRGLVNAKRKIVKSVFNQYIKSKKLWFLNEWLLNKLKWFNDIKLVAVYEPLKDAFDLQQGIPTDNPLRILLNDDTLHSQNISASDYKTCFSWINAVCAADDKSVNQLLAIIKEKFSEEGYAFRVTFTAINARALIMIANISYNRDEESIQKGLAFCRECSALLIKNGFLPYRSGSGSYDKLPVQTRANAAFLSAIKSAIDPVNILSPGKYNL